MDLFEYISWDSDIYDYIYSYLMNNGRLPDDIDENYYRSLEFIN